MLRILQITIVALGLLLFPSLGQTQQGAQSEQGQAATEQNPTQTLPIPLPIEIVEDQATTDARERREAETRQHEKDDLVAQQGMNIATQAINEATQDMNKATQRMADYALYTTWIVGIGTIFLFVTLWLTSKATKAAEKSVAAVQKIGNAQLRAYLTIKGCSIEYVNDQPVAKVMLINSGQTPANNVLFVGRIFVSENPGYFLVGTDIDSLSKGRLGRDQPIELKAEKKKDISPEEIAGLKSGTHTLVVHGEVEYTDIFKVRWTFEYEFCTGGDYGEVKRSGDLSVSKKAYEEHKKDNAPTA